ncbi:hypothetical protein PHLCEN_2v12058 [Hermanssonia centrifuga]|uniref:T6SS Phospholipase effector Tle1-like catalytic domain-containing protein n=1 Tax=Hermanssonia centrifuga TaxID=98765 RepID=A0A2R6NI53_9APHY|nr:hypothetical protein PHLCEN_2v12058 [Hermanssonia centrifuga]
MNHISKMLDEAIAWNLEAHVLDEAGDKICIFGFSRGAYTARALAGMIGLVGLLPASNLQQVPFAYKMYVSKQWDQAHRFKDTFSMEVPIEFLGVWDTVSSVGLFGRSLPYTAQCATLKTFRHALSADERRAKFKPSLYIHPTDNTKVKTDVKEVWFAGCHCGSSLLYSSIGVHSLIPTNRYNVDVGGGSVKNSEKHNLARIPLRWMIRECFRTHTGILFLTHRLPDLSLDPASLYPKVLPRPPALFTPPPPVVDIDGHQNTRMLTEEEADAIDAHCDIYDQLAMRPFWWLLEILPVGRWVRTETHEWLRERTLMNLGAGRKLYREIGDGLYLHRTMEIRMEAEGLTGGKYRPRAGFTADPVWVD